MRASFIRLYLNGKTSYQDVEEPLNAITRKVLGMGMTVEMLTGADLQLTPLLELLSPLPFSTAPADPIQLLLPPVLHSLF